MLRLSIQRYRALLTSDQYDKLIAACGPPNARAVRAAAGRDRHAVRVRGSISHGLMFVLMTGSCGHLSGTGTDERREGTLDANDASARDGDALRTSRGIDS